MSVERTRRWFDRPRRPRSPQRRSRRRDVVVSGAVVLLTTIITALGLPPPAAGVDGPVNSANARYIAALYEDLLGREVDTAGLDYQLTTITAGGDQARKALAYALLFSEEGSRNEVRRAYDDLLQRAPDPAGEDYWTAHLQGHGVIDLRVLLLASDEYHARAGATTDSWLDALYGDLLGRSIDPAGAAHWRAVVDRGSPRALVVAGIYLSDEALGRRVDAYYLEGLGRIPGPSERAGVIPLLRSEGERGVRAIIWSSDERFERHLQAAFT